VSSPSNPEILAQANSSFLGNVADVEAAKPAPILLESVNKALRKERLAPEEQDAIKTWVLAHPESQKLQGIVGQVVHGRDVSDDDFNYLSKEVQSAGSGFARALAHDQGISRAKALREQAAKIDTRGPTQGFLPNAAALAKDASAVLGGSGGSLVENIGQVAGLVVPGMDPDNPITRAGTAVKDFYEPLKSPELHRSQEAYREEVDAADGEFAKGLAAAVGTVKHPMQTANFMADQLPLMLPSGAAGRVAGGIALARGASEKLAGKLATGAAVAVGSGLQGASVGGQTYQDLMAPEMDQMWAQVPEIRSAPPESRQQVREDMALRLSRQAGAVGTAESLLTNFIPGSRSSDRVIAGAGQKVMGPIGRKLAMAAKNILGEGLQETLEEGPGQAIQNKFVQQVDPNRKWSEGVGESTALGFVAGVGMGAPTGGIEGFVGKHQDPMKPAQTKPAAPAATSGYDPLQRATALGETRVANEASPAGAAMKGKEDRYNKGFEALVNEFPELAEEIDKFRAKDPLRGPEEFKEHLDQVKNTAALQQIQQRPEVQQANAQAAQAVTKHEAAQAILSGTADPTQAPPGGLTAKDVQQIQQDGGKAIEEKAHAAAENARTVAQTAAKDAEADKPSESLAPVLDETAKNLEGAFQDAKAAMASGAMPFSEKVFREKAEAAEIPPERVELQLVQLKEQVRKREEAAASKAESGGSEFTPAQGKGVPASDGKLPLPPLSVLGKDVKAATGAGNSHDYTLAVVPMHSLVTSDNPGYPTGMQPRDTSRFTSAQTVQRIGANLNPDLLMNTPSVTDGAPVVGPDMAVEGGNHRVMGLRNAAAQGKFEAYKQTLLSHAEEYGLDPAAIQKMKEPVLVRMRKTEVSDRTAFARELNQSMTNSMDMTSRAKADAAAMTPEHLDLLDSEKKLSDPTNRSFMGRFISDVVPSADQKSMWTASNEASIDAIRRVQDALFHAAYGDDSPAFDLVSKAAMEEQNPEGLNILSALKQAAPFMAKLRNLVAKGERADLVISPEIMQAVSTINVLRDTKMSLNDFLVQGSLLEGQQGMSPLAARILEDLYNARQKPKALTTYLKEYARLALESSNPMAIGGMFDVEGPTATREETWNNATGEVRNVAKEHSGEPEFDLTAPGPTEDGRGTSPAGPQASEGDRGGPGPSQPDNQEGASGPRVKKEGFGSSNRLIDKDKYAKLKARLSEKFDEARNTLNSGINFDPELLTIGTQMAAFFIEGGVRKFAEVAKTLSEEMGRTIAELRPYLALWYNGARDMMDSFGLDTAGMDDGATVSRELAKMLSAAAVDPKLNGDRSPLLAALESRPLPSDNIQLRKILTEIDGQAPDSFRMKEAQEALEVVIAQQARGIVRDIGGDTAQTFDALVRLYKSQPNLDIRTTTSMENQAYSTPVPLGYLADLLAGTDKGSVYEPTAGNGMLLLAMDPREVRANELDSGRFRLLDSQGFGKTRMGDATTAFDDKFVEPRSMDSVVANPPFGKMSEPRVYDGIQFMKLDHLIAAMSLRAMKDTGRATLILGANKEEGAAALGDKRFLSWLSSRYNVVGNFEVAGDLYSRQGASWPVRVLTIHGRATEGTKASAVSLFTAPRANTWEEVYSHASKILGSSEWRESAHRVPNDAPDVQVRGGSSDGEGGAAPGGPARLPGGRRPGERGQPGESGGAVAPIAPGGAQPERGAPGANGGGQLAPVESGMGSEPPQTVVTAGGREQVADVPLGGDGSVAGSVAPDPEAFVQPYTPRAFQGEMDQGLFVPTNLLQPIQEGLDRIEKDVGDLSEFIAKELQLTPEEVKDGRFFGAQVEAIAAAIWNMKKGKGTIIADDTGVGKGRQAAALIRWGIKNGKTPIFMTQKGNLFSDMYGDLLDIGTTDAKPYLINQGEAIYITDENGKIVPAARNGSKLGIQEITKTGKPPEGSNCIFATYSQFRKNNAQRRALEALAPNSILIMDEAHEAAGEESATGEFFRKTIPQFQGVTYLSATWAKRASNMAVYSQTGIGDVGMTHEDLMSAIVDGGLALQGIVSQSLARHGQFVRRERSFDGVDYDTVKLPDVEGSQRSSSDNVTQRLRSIIDVDRMFGEYIKGIEDSLLQIHGGFNVSTAKASARITHSEFSSVVHNAVRQMALAMKADDCADMAIKAIQEGEAVVIGLESTMGSLLDDYTKSNGLKVGDPIPELSWKAVLRRYADRTRRFTITKFGTQETEGEDRKESIEIPMSDLPRDLREAYEDLYDSIDEMDNNLSASPIDWIRKRIEDAGFRTAEITARGNSIDYSGLIPTVGGVPQTKIGRVQVAKDFNSGKVHAVIVNVAGATGISLHSDRRWTDTANPRRRHMIVAQPALDINMFKQLLGRVHRTGQIVPPRYSILSLDLPSEIRPIANLQKKVKSLNSSTSAATKGNMDVQGGIDLVNQYGDQVVQAYLNEHPSLASHLGIKLGEDSKGMSAVRPGVAWDATGRLAIMPVATQAQFYEEVEPRLRELLDYLTLTGQNKLEKRKQDLQAQELKRTTLFPGSGTEGPFSDPSYLVEAKTKSLTRIPTPEDVKAVLEKELAGRSPEEHRTHTLALAGESWKRYTETASADALMKASEAKRRTAHGLPKVGETFTLKMGDDQVQGVVTRIGWKGDNHGGNPYAASKWTVWMATNGAGSFHVSLSQYTADATPSMFGLSEVFSPDASGGHGRTTLVVGNLLGAYTQLKGKRGEIVDFTTNDGTVVTGMVLPKSFDANVDVKSSVEIADPQMALKTLAAIRTTFNPSMLSRDENVVATDRGDGTIQFELLDGTRVAAIAAKKDLGLEVSNGRARLNANDAMKVLSKGRFSAQKASMEDAGLMEGQALKLEAFDDPMRNEVFEHLNEHTLRLANQIIKDGGGQTDEYGTLQALKRLKQENVKMGSLARRVQSITSKMSSGEMVQPKELRAFLREMADRLGKPLDNKAPISAGQADRMRALFKSAKYIGETVARASMYRRFEGRKTALGIDNIDLQKLGPSLDKLVPFMPLTNERRASAEHFLWCYNEAHPEKPLDLSKREDLKAFGDYLSGTTKLQVNKWTAGIVAAIGLGAILPAGVIPHELVSLGIGAAGLFAGVKLVKMGIDNVLTMMKTPKARFYSMGRGWKELSDSIEQALFRTQEVANPAHITLDEIDNEIKKVVMAGKNPAQKALEWIHPSKESQDKYDALAGALADLHDKHKPLPPELAHLGTMAREIIPRFARLLREAKINTLEDYFPRVYQFDGLQALKGDAEAVKRLAQKIAPQILENSPDRVQRWRADFPDATLSDVAYNMALVALNGIYDGTEEARHEVAKKKNQNGIEFAARAASASGEFNERIYQKIRSAQEGSWSPYTSGHLLKRKVDFDLPTSWRLSEGSQVGLVDRNFVRVMRTYINQVSRSIAQRQVFDSDLASQLLTSLGGKGSDERREIEKLVSQSLNNTLRPIEADSRETARAIYSSWSKINTLAFLGLSAVTPFRNVLFSLFKGSVLSDMTPFMKGGAILAREMIPGLRSLPDAKKLREHAEEAGAMFRLASPGFSGTKNVYNAIMHLNMRSWEAVDVASFWLGNVMGHKILKKALGGDREQMDFLHEILGADRSQELLTGRDPLAMTQADLNRCGVVYKNLISGYGITHFRPQFMNSEHGKFWTQFMHFLAEDTKFVNDRIIHGSRLYQMRFARGLALGGVLAMMLNGVVNHATGSNRPELGEQAGANQVVTQLAQQSGGMADFEKLLKVFAEDDPARRPSKFDLAAELMTLPMREVAGAASLAHELSQNAYHLGELPVSERPGAMVMPLVRPLEQLPASRMLGIKIHRTAGEERLRELRSEAREQLKDGEE